MTDAQREWLKGKLKWFAFIAYCIVAVVCAALGNLVPTLPYVSVAMMGALILPIAFATVYIPIALAVWHWRLLGVCANENEKNLLDAYWFWIYRSENWLQYLTEDVCDRYEEGEQRQILLGFIDKLSKVRKPRWL
jgi:hypothetical protein